MYGMKKMLFLFLAAALTVVIGSSGISADYSEVADLELVRTIAIDRDGEKLTLTACSGMGLEDETALISSIDADSLASAVNLLRRSGSRREPFFAHVEHLVIGEDALKNGNGISPYLDYISRSLETRMDTNIFIVRGVSAKDFVLNRRTKNKTDTEAYYLSFCKSHDELFLDVVQVLWDRYIMCHY